jgi:hypothetical protein
MSSQPILSLSHLVGGTLQVGQGPQLYEAGT